MHKNILVAGIPRSGSTWIANILTCNGHLRYIHEPDNERHTYSGYYYKQDLPRFPFIRPGDAAENYFRLFYHAFYEPYFGMGSFSNKVLFKLTGFKKEKVEEGLVRHYVNKAQKRYPAMMLYKFLPKEVTAPGNRLVKSVHCVLSLEYLVRKLDISPVLIIRHPASVVSSCLQMQNPDMDRKLYNDASLMSSLFGDRRPDISGLTSIESLAGLQVAIFYKVIAGIVERHPGIRLIVYEDFCSDPVNEAKSLFSSLGLDFDQKVAGFINASNTEGEGYEIKRIASQQANVWQSRLTGSQIADIRKGYTAIRPSFYKEFS